MSSLFANLALLLGGFAVAALLYRQSQSLAQRSLHYMFALGALSLALAALGRLVLTRSGSEQQTLQLMLDNLAYYAGLPMIASVAIAHGWNKQWSRAAWGRWLLGLFALFELVRRSDTGVLYSQGLALLTCLALLAGVLKGYQGATRLFGLAGTLLLSIGLLAFGPAPLAAGFQQDALYRLALAGFIILCGYSFSRTPQAAA
ncbi:hypothetical protein [Marinobacterium sedimentorum]|uniref:hypothetical protein n=1 Tax=Marinobacterium sedimentorum TaxID=2927804 RepID=UPI0020C6A902|nr:hypothetical protein [Marinobacterium sedimentorum]MCP8689700.1 hypothetical protein [Marinobacterium sedimentorum]